LQNEKERSFSVNSTAPMSDLIKLPTFSDLSSEVYQSREQSPTGSNSSDEIRKTINDESSKCYEDSLLKQTIGSFLVMHCGNVIAKRMQAE
jgi:hypothetical protein